MSWTSLSLLAYRRAVAKTRAWYFWISNSNLAESPCQASFETEMAAVLSAEGETPENATALAHSALTILTLGDLGPRPFLVAAPSGTDYSFFVEKTKSSCILHLYGRQKGFVSYTNNLTYIDSRPLPGCSCAE